MLPRLFLLLGALLLLLLPDALLLLLPGVPQEVSEMQTVHGWLAPDTVARRRELASLFVSRGLFDVLNSLYTGEACVCVGGGGGAGLGSVGWCLACCVQAASE